MQWQYSQGACGFPRTRGDGPAKVVGLPDKVGFPPHTRGWTHGVGHDASRRAVSPAHAGMDLRLWPPTTSRRGFPRTRGDGPWVLLKIAWLCQFPPHTRGWTPCLPPHDRWIAVSPAHAGMDRQLRPESGRPVGFPRTRGDGPGTLGGSVSISAFPPHTRGWTAFPRPKPTAGRVSPAHAGMDPMIEIAEEIYQGFPRTRGDGTLGERRDSKSHAVSPAHAGMDPNAADESA